MSERLQKVLAAAGVASRRDAESLISSGKVSVNGKVVRETGAKVDPERDHIVVDGRPIPRDVERLYVLLYKPKGYVTTREDPHATDTVMQLVVPPLEARLGRDSAAVRGLHPVGRLDAQSEGLLILTNDGAFTNAMTHPRHRVPKVYTAEVRGVPTEEALERVRAGIPLYGQRTLPARARVVRVDRARNTAKVEVVLREGRNQQVRRMLQAVGYPVNRLMRTAVGPVTLDRMKPGQWRFLTPAEVEALRHAGSAPDEEPAPPRPRRSQAPRGGRAAGRGHTAEDRRPPRTAPRGASRAGPRGDSRAGMSRPGPRDAEGARGTGPRRPSGPPAGAPRPPRNPGGRPKKK